MKCRFRILRRKDWKKHSEESVEIESKPQGVISNSTRNKLPIETRTLLPYIFTRPKDKFDKKDIIRILTELNFPFSKPEVDQWIWEVDEDLDGSINEYEFTLMYKRCIFDKTWLEPRNLFNLVQFLMYDLAGRGKITV